MPGSHHVSEPPQRGPEELAQRLIRNNLLVLVVLNAAAAVAITGFAPGTSPALLALRSILPLWVWGVFGFGTVAVLLIARLHVWGHGLAIPLWFTIAAATVLGVLQQKSSAPAASLLFAALMLCFLGLHVHGLVYRAALRRQR